LNVWQQGFDLAVQNGPRGSALLTGDSIVIGDRCCPCLSARHFFIASHCGLSKARELLSPGVATGHSVVPRICQLLSTVLMGDDAE
jgi:hypothetical protein